MERKIIRISIIMPLYNASRYLRETLDSVLKQTFMDFELICVDDASTDATMEILLEYQIWDSRIRILCNTERHGAAYSRNRGMKEAVGEYFAFLDGDDIFEEEMFETAYRTASEHEADLVMYEYQHVASDSVYNKLKVFHSEQYTERYCIKPFTVLDHEPYEFLNWGLGPWNKLYKREVIEQNQLAFQELPCSNDVYFVCMAMMLSKRMLSLNDDRVMVYVRDHDEPTRISADRDPMCCYQALWQIAVELKNRGLFAELCPYFYYRFLKAIRSTLRQCRTEEKEMEFYQFLQQEGIGRIRSISGEFYDRLDDYVRNSVEQFEKLDCHTRWYRKELGLKMELSQKCNAQEVIRLFMEYGDAHKAIGIWGVGANGSSLLEFCREHNLKVDMVVDKSEKKQGCIVEGYPVKPPEEIDGRLQAIIVTTRHICDSVRNEVAGWNIEVIDVNQFLRVY